MNALTQTNSTFVPDAEVVQAVQDLAWLLQQYQFSDREFRIAGVRVEDIKRWTRALALLTDA